MLSLMFIFSKDAVFCEDYIAVIYVFILKLYCYFYFKFCLVHEFYLKKIAIYDANYI